MIFASDLDRTMIFSAKNFTYDSNESIMLDYREDRAVSFMTKNSLEKLKHLSHQLDFVPVSAREKNQVEDVRFSENGVLVNHFICGNGSTVVINGEISNIWESNISNIKNKLDLEHLNSMLTLNFPNEKIIERSFGFEIFIKGEESYLKNLFKDFSDIRIESDHRRSYLMFNGISKLNALQFLIKELNYSKVVASGDSLMDLPMIQKADLGIVSMTGDLKNYEKPLLKGKNIVLVENKNAIRTSDNILDLTRDYFKL